MSVWFVRSEPQKRLNRRDAEESKLCVARFVQREGLKPSPTPEMMFMCRGAVCDPPVNNEQINNCKTGS
jgi:hypothetical protein